MVSYKPKGVPGQFGFPRKTLAGAGVERGQPLAGVAPNREYRMEIVPGTAQDAFFRLLEPLSDLSQARSFSLLCTPAINTLRVSGK